MLKRLLTMLVALALAISALPALADSSKTYYIEVDIANQITTVFRSSDKAVVRQMICSSGTGNNTPRGTFHLEKSRSTDRSEWYYIGKYSCYVKYPTRIQGAILFHSIPYAKQDMSTIDQEAVQQLGSKASHGCIRLRWQDAKWIAKNCPDGTRVRIFTGASRKAELRKLLLAEGYSESSGMTYEQFVSPAFETNEAGSLGRGAEGDAVNSLQQRLIGLGFYSGSASGVYDSATIVAVMRFQAAAALPVTGIANAALIERIMTGDDITGNYSTLEPGCAGPVVARFQQTMKALGFYGGEIDGSYSAALADAVDTWCLCTGSALSRQVGPEARDRADALLAELNQRFGAGRFGLVVLADTTKGATAAKKTALYKRASSGSKRLVTIGKGKSVDLIEKKGKWYKVAYGSRTGYVQAGALKLKDVRTLSAHWGIPAPGIGVADMDGQSIGDGVTALQDRLRALGFFEGESLPIYTIYTTSAVAAYQLAAGQTPTGMASAELQNAIFASDEITGTAVTLQTGSNSPAVAAMQRALRATQYYGGECGGSFDYDTEQAVRLFTRTNGMEETGVATPEVQLAILNQYLDCEAKYGSGNYALVLTPVESRIAKARSNTTLYKKKSTDSKAVASLKKGAIVDVLEEGGSWCRVRADGREGYVRSKFLKVSTRIDQVAEFSAAGEPQVSAIEYGDGDDALEVAAPEPWEPETEDEAFGGITVEDYEEVPEENDGWIDVDEPDSQLLGRVPAMLPQYLI